MECDVAIVGGGPAGSTIGALLRKYNADLKVAIFERETFPRDHVGESLLPPICPILFEMGAWDRIEAAGFPIKLGATYRWGRSPELWDFSFIPASEFKEEARPAKFEGQRRHTAFQVDRAIYDQILLETAAQAGCEVRMGAKIAAVETDEDAVHCLRLESGESVSAKHYVDASGNSGIVRRAFDVPVSHHPTLQNIAIWDYWQNAEWAVKIGIGGTRIQVRSLPYGWLWFIPLGPTRTSIGLVVPARYYKDSGMRPSDIYAKALRDEEEITKLLKNARCENKLQSTKDWSFLAERHYGGNWYLVGECAGFADPILSAGVTMAHVAGQQLAFTINEIEHGGDAAWLKSEFETRQKQRIRTHIRFGDYWYTANAQFADLKDFTAELAQVAGLDLEPERAWDWIARGGFIDEDLGVGAGGFDLAALKETGPYLTEIRCGSPLEEYNDFKLNLEGATLKDRASYFKGRVGKTRSYVRNGRVLPLQGAIGVLVEILQQETKLPRILQSLQAAAAQQRPNSTFHTNVVPHIAGSLEAMVSDGWVRPSLDPRYRLAKLDSTWSRFHFNRDNAS